MKKIYIFMIIFIFLFNSFLSIYSDSVRDRKNKAERLVKDAIKLIKKNGLEAAIPKFHDKSGNFIDGEYYIFIVDFNGITLAHGGNQALVGKNMMDLKDPDGVFFIKEFIKIAKEKTKGWVNYKWPNPQTKKIERKSSYVQSIPGENYFLGCGIYLD
jgi:signal transduction histidine kinase